MIFGILVDNRSKNNLVVSLLCGGKIAIYFGWSWGGFLFHATTHNKLIKNIVNQIESLYIIHIIFQKQIFKVSITFWIILQRYSLAHEPILLFLLFRFLFLCQLERLTQAVVNLHYSSIRVVCFHKKRIVAFH